MTALCVVTIVCLAGRLVVVVVVVLLLAGLIGRRVGRAR
mgnify:CR=1 FL=1|jgi:hypothetical protein